MNSSFVNNCWVLSVAVLLAGTSSQVRGESLHLRVGRDNKISHYQKYREYSPFYLREHPELRHQGDITDIQGMAQEGDSFSNIKGVENVFEKNIGSFEHLMTGTSGRIGEQETDDLNENETHKNHHKKIHISKPMSFS